VRLARTLLQSLLILGFATANASAQLNPGFGASPNQDLQETQQQTASPRTPVITNAPATVQPQNPLQSVPQYQQNYQQQYRPRALPRSTGEAASETQPEENEFQTFIFHSTGQRLPLFGYNLFEGAPSTFAPVQNVPVTPDYVIGPGDELLIRAWGQIDIDYRAVVDRNGMINIPRVGSISVAGVPYKDITKFVHTAVSRNFRNFDLLVTMGQLRSIQVFVVGYAKRPGAYTVSSLSTLVNALFAAGGPSTAGSMRTVQLKRDGKVVTEIDLYDLLLAGDKSKDAKLLPGDVIYIPPIGALAAVTGSVNNPAVFELNGPTTLGTLMGYAGGLATTAQSKQMTVERIDRRQGRIVDQLDYSAAAAQRPVKDGDLVSVLAILPKFDNAVTLRGNVATPLRYPWHSGMRIRDLIPDKDALITPEYYRRQNLAVRTDLNRKAQPAVPNREGQTADELRTSTAVTQRKLTADVRNLGDEINWDYAVIERLNRADLSTSLIPFNLGKAILENDPSQNLPLVPGDVVTVFSKTDVAAPIERRPVVVSLEGEFAHAGVYQARSGETVRQIVARVGGLTPQAYIYGTEFTRESTRKEQEERLKKALNQLEEDVQRAAASRARNVTSQEDAAALEQQAKSQQAIINRLRGLQPTGRIVLQLPANAKAADLPSISLEDGDRLYVPARPSTVSVFGSVFNESSFLYGPDKSVSDYISLAGGPRKEADKDSIYVIRADGSVVSGRNSSFLTASLDSTRLMPGDAIVVPEDFSRTTWTKDLKDWTQIFYQFGLGAAALKVIQQ
jgi:protein involved in polysaccharide export with SLBB domain